MASVYAYLRKPKKEIAKDYIVEIAGCFIYAISVVCFSSPNNIAPGGITGLAIMGEYVFGTPISIGTLTLNIPLLIMAWLFLGHQFTIRTIISVGIITAAIEVCNTLLPVYKGEMMLASLSGGVLTGIGLGMVFMRGSTTGGTDIASKLLQLRFPNMSVGRLLMVADGLVLLLSAIVYRNIENALYGLIGIFTATRIIDSILYGLDTGRVMMIVTNMENEVAACIHRQIDRGCTILQGKGSYTGEERPVLLCAVRKNQFHSVKTLVYSIDPQAFVVAMEANEVIGKGFKMMEK